MCERFGVAIRELGMTPTQIAKALGYANATTIAKVLKGESFVDVERLQKLSELTTATGKPIDMNWLILGKEAQR